MNKGRLKDIYGIQLQFIIDIAVIIGALRSDQEYEAEMGFTCVSSCRKRFEEQKGYGSSQQKVQCIVENSYRDDSWAGNKRPLFILLGHGKELYTFDEQNQKRLITHRQQTGFPYSSFPSWMLSWPTLAELLRQSMPGNAARQFGAVWKQASTE